MQWLDFLHYAYHSFHDISRTYVETIIIGPIYTDRFVCEYILANTALPV